MVFIGQTMMNRKTDMTRLIAYLGRAQEARSSSFDPCLYIMLRNKNSRVFYDLYNTGKKCRRYLWYNYVILNTLFCPPPWKIQTTTMDKVIEPDISAYAIEILIFYLFRIKCRYHKINHGNLIIDSPENMRIMLVRFSNFF